MGLGGETSDGIAGDGGAEDIFQKWDQNAKFGLILPILVPFYF